MSMRQLIRSEVVRAFIALGDIPKPMRYLSFTGRTVRDIEAGTSVPETVPHDLPMVVRARFKQHEIDGVATIGTDQKFVFPAEHLPIEEPGSEDLLICDKGYIWEVQQLLGDPADAAWVLHCRTTKRRA